MAGTIISPEGIAANAADNRREAEKNVKRLTVASCLGCGGTAVTSLLAVAFLGVGLINHRPDAINVAGAIAAADFVSTAVTIISYNKAKREYPIT